MIKGGNRFVQNTIYILALRTISVVSTLFLMLYFSHTLSKEAFGVYVNFWTQLNMSLVVACLGIPIFVFTYDKDKLGQILNQIPKKLIWYYRLYLLLVGVGFSISQYVTNDLFASSIFSAVCLSCFVALSAGALIFEALSIVNQYYKKLVAVSVFYNIIYIALFLLYYFQKIDSEALALTLMLNASVKFLTLEQQNFKSNNREELAIQEVLNVWKGTGWYDLSQNVIKHLDKYILSFFIAKELLATYTVLTYELPVFALVFASIRSSTSLFLTSRAHTNKEIRIYLKQVGKLLGFFIIPAVLFLLFFSKDVITLLFSEKYVAYTSLFCISIIKMLAYNFVFSAVLQYFKKIKIISNGVWIDFIISIILVLPLYALMGLNGIMLSVVISTFIQIGYYTYHTNKILEGKWNQIIPIKIWVKQILFFSILISLVYWVSNTFFETIIYKILLALAILVPIIFKLIKGSMRQINKL